MNHRLAAGFLGIILTCTGVLIYKDQVAGQGGAEAIPQYDAKTSGKYTCPRSSEAASDEQINSWIKQSLTVMHEHKIAGSFDGIKRNLIRESGCMVHAINLTDSNARAGIPSKGLLQTVQPTFDAYHVDGTSKDIYDPVANLVAACNYADHTYGSIDNVHGAY